MTVTGLVLAACNAQQTGSTVEAYPTTASSSDSSPENSIDKIRMAIQEQSILGTLARIISPVYTDNAFVPGGFGGQEGYESGFRLRIFDLSSNTEVFEPDFPGNERAFGYSDEMTNPIYINQVNAGQIEDHVRFNARIWVDPETGACKIGYGSDAEDFKFAEQGAWDAHNWTVKNITDNPNKTLAEKAEEIATNLSWLQHNLAEIEVKKQEQNKSWEERITKWYHFTNDGSLIEVVDGDVCQGPIVVVNETFEPK